MNNRRNFQMNNQQNMNNPNNLHNQFPDYFIDNEYNLELFQKAEDYAKNYSNNLTKSQLRNIYNEVKNIEKRYNSKKISFNQVMTRIKLLKAKVRYNTGRKTNALNKNFARELEQWIDKIKTEGDFKGFCIFFESVVGFFYGFNTKN
ncbi:MAG: type III-A CRISPR-associated protein Csm2 [Exilispira sp.]